MSNFPFGVVTGAAGDALFLDSAPYPVTWKGLNGKADTITSYLFGDVRDTYSTHYFLYPGSFVTEAC